MRYVGIKESSPQELQLRDVQQRGWNGAFWHDSPGLGGRTHSARPKSEQEQDTRQPHKTKNTNTESSPCPDPDQPPCPHTWAHTQRQTQE